MTDSVNPLARWDGPFLMTYNEKSTPSKGSSICLIQSRWGLNKAQSVLGMSHYHGLLFCLLVQSSEKKGRGLCTCSQTDYETVRGCWVFIRRASTPQRYDSQVRRS